QEPLAGTATLLVCFDVSVSQISGVRRFRPPPDLAFWIGQVPSFSLLLPWPNLETVSGAVKGSESQVLPLTCRRERGMLEGRERPPPLNETKRNPWPGFHLTQRRGGSSAVGRSVSRRLVTHRATGVTPSPGRDM